VCDHNLASAPRLARSLTDKKEHEIGGRMSTSSHTSRWSEGLAVGLLLFCGPHGDAVADPPPAQAGSAPSSSASDTLPAKGNFMSSLKQAFSEDLDKEVVRGHFDVGSPPDTHRYYCLVDPKTGKSEPNAVAGQLVVRHDKMTGIKGAAVTFFTCADAEQKGILVTSGYVLSAAVSSKITPPAPVQKPAVAAAPAAAAASAPLAAAAVAPTAAPTAAAPVAAVAAPVAPPVAVSADGSLQSEVMAVYARFIAGQNAHDRAVVSEVLLDSKDFVWAQYGGGSLWGYKEAMDAFAEAWKGTWRLEPQPKELRIASVAPDAAVLITPLLFTQGDPGKEPSTVSIRWGGVFVKTKSGWRIASIFITPRAPKGG
jgi:hypothetical protein